MTINVEHTLDKLEQKCFELDAYRDHLIKESVNCIKKLADDLMKSALQSHCGVVEKLGCDGLKPVKEQFTSLVDSLGGKVHQILEDDNLWVYKQRVDVSALSQLRSSEFTLLSEQLPQKLEKALKSLLSPIGALLTTYNLAKEGDWQVANSNYEYIGAIPNTPSLVESVKELALRHQDYDRLIDELKNSEKKSEQDSVLDLWDSI
ncbi:hypothetical protein L4C34_17435 [Vibrio profundum]|uniref:hypothetical protein n=1 Tax=Vibrio profundum TaxID=2910247 RepID=UPI003D142B28